MSYPDLKQAGADVMDTKLGLALADLRKKEEDRTPYDLRRAGAAAIRGAFPDVAASHDRRRALDDRQKYMKDSHELRNIIQMAKAIRDKQKQDWATEDRVKNDSKDYVSRWKDIVAMQQQITEILEVDPQADVTDMKDALTAMKKEVKTQPSADTQEKIKQGQDTSPAQAFEVSPETQSEVAKQDERFSLHGRAASSFAGHDPAAQAMNPSPGVEDQAGSLGGLFASQPLAASAFQAGPDSTGDMNIKDQFTGESFMNAPPPGLESVGAQTMQQKSIVTQIEQKVPTIKSLMQSNPQYNYVIEQIIAGKLSVSDAITIIKQYEGM